MSQHDVYSSALYSMDTARAEIQVVATRNHLVLDVQAWNYQTDGHPRTECALAHLSLKDARRLIGLLNEALAAAQDVPDPNQTSLWSNATTAAVADELRLGRPA